MCDKFCRSAVIVHIIRYVAYSLLYYGYTKTALNSHDAKNNQISYRLPNNTKPESYDITVVTNIDRNDFNFSGRVVIKLRVLETSYSITIHARQLNINTVKLTTISGGVIILNPFTFDHITEFLVIPAQIQLQKGTQYILIVEYSGVLRTNFIGFYRGTYTSAKGEKKFLAATQFEPTDARHAFPCYDEPALKAIFTVHIERGETYHAISNTKEKRNAAVNGRVRTDFEPTPMMSTYLVAFIISDFTNKILNATADYPIAHRVFASDNVINETSYALDEGIKTLVALEKYLQVPYEMPALDQAVIQ